MSIPLALGNLRHLYEQMLDGRVTNTAEAARGLLGRSIEALERLDQARQQAEAQAAVYRHALMTVSRMDHAPHGPSNACAACIAAAALKETS